MGITLVHRGFIATATALTLAVAPLADLPVAPASATTSGIIQSTIESFSGWLSGQIDVEVLRAEGAEMLAESGDRPVYDPKE